MSAPPPARATRRATRQRSRAPPGLAESLPPDTLRVICRSLKGGAPDDAARSLLRIQQTCKSWRAAALISEDEIWEELALKRFPSLRGILDAEPTTAPYRRLYRQQLLGERARHYKFPPFVPGPDMSAYIYSCELYLDDELIGIQANGNAYDIIYCALDMRAGPRSYEEWERLVNDQCKLLGPADHALRLRVSVTRRADLSTIVLFDEHTVLKVCKEENDQGMVFRFHYLSKPLPSKVAAAMLYTYCEDDTRNRLSIAPTFSVEGPDGPAPKCPCVCEFLEADEAEADEAIVSKYLAHYAPWPDDVPV